MTFFNRSFIKLSFHLFFFFINTQISANVYYVSSSVGNNQNNGLSEVLPNGYYAITVTTDNLGHHNALLKVGDLVDIVFVGESFESSREYVSFEEIEVFDIHGLQEGYGSYSLTLLVEPEKVAAFTRAIGSPMLVWARGRHLDQASIWHQDSKQSKVQPWKVL